MVSRQTMGVALGVLLAIVAYAWSGQYWIDLVDEGYFLDLSQRVLDGQLPYRDFTTYYTPGIFYLFALAMKLFGVGLLQVRYLMAILRGLCALLLYVLGRRLAPGPIAWLPFLVVAALDHWPIEPEPHPSWPSILACLLALECIVRHHSTGQRRWLVLSGGAAGLAFLFKQNVGAFTALGVAGYVMLRPGVRPRGLQVAFAVGVALLVTMLMRSNLDPVTAGALWLPLLATLGVLLYRALRRVDVGDTSVLGDAAASAGGFGVVMVSWLVPLAAALGPTNVPYGLFAGEVDQASIAEPFARFTRGAQVLLLIVIWASALLGPRGRWRLYAAAASLVVLVLPVSDATGAELTHDPMFLPQLRWLDDAFGSLHLYLGPLAAWGGISMLLARRNDTGPFVWYLLFGALAALSMYPRVDTLHAIVASPPLLVVGAGAIGVLYVRLKAIDGWRRASVLACVLSVPLLAVMPQLVWRLATVVSPDDSGARLDYVALDLERAPVLVPRQMGESVRGSVANLQARTRVDEPVFVYPVAPLLNFLAERRNPTPFDHYLPGTLSSADFASVIDTLERTRPSYVVWDHLGVQRWETDAANRPLSDYLWRCYDEVAAFRYLLVLERRVGGCG